MFFHQSSILSLRNILVCFLHQQVHQPHNPAKATVYYETSHAEQLSPLSDLNIRNKDLATGSLRSPFRVASLPVKFKLKVALFFPICSFINTVGVIQTITFAPSDSQHSMPDPLSFIFRGSALCVHCRISPYLSIKSQELDHFLL